MNDAEAQVGVMAAAAMGLLIDAVKQIPPEGEVPLDQARVGNRQPS